MYVLFWDYLSIPSAGTLGIYRFVLDILSKEPEPMSDSLESRPTPRDIC
jgi:hypothetical protein